MITRAVGKYLKISPKKLSLVTRLISRKKVDEAIYMLTCLNKKGAKLVKSIVESARSNASRIPEKKFNEADLYISKISVQMGPALKRFRAMSMGRAGTIRKRTSHVLVELDLATIQKAKAKTSKKRKVKTRK